VPIGAPVVSAEFPTEVVDGAGHPLPFNAPVTEPPFTFFDDFAWRSFIALNWPAQKGIRGMADKSAVIGNVDGPRVWETWKSGYEAIPPKGMTPSKWASFDSLTPCTEIPAQGSGLHRIISSFTKFGDISQAQFGFPLAGPLVAQNDTFVHYEIKVNKPEFEFIREHQLYDRTVLDGVMQSTSAPLSFTLGSVEVKAAWREFASESEDVRKRFYRTNATIKNYATGRSRSTELGLIGLHIVQKTTLRPQWVWATFEHVDNVPATGQSPTPSAVFTLNDTGKPQILDPSDAPDTITDATYLKPDGKPFQSRMQVVRVRAIAPSTVRTNVAYQNALRGTVWVNYMLVMTQWPTAPAQPSGSPFPDLGTGTSITNTTLETYFQDDTSCMVCHNEARAKNLDFVFFPILNASSQDPGPANSPTRAFVAQLKKNLDASRARSHNAMLRHLGTHE
jgi:hypothetical protein